MQGKENKKKKRKKEKSDKKNIFETNKLFLYASTNSFNLF